MENKSLAQAAEAHMQEYGSSTPGSILLLAFMPRLAAGINQSKQKDTARSAWVQCELFFIVWRFERVCVE